MRKRKKRLRRGRATPRGKTCGLEMWELRTRKKKRIANRRKGDAKEKYTKQRNNWTAKKRRKRPTKRRKVMGREKIIRNRNSGRQGRGRIGQQKGGEEECEGKNKNPKEWTARKRKKRRFAERRKMDTKGIKTYESEIVDGEEEEEEACKVVKN